MLRKIIKNNSYNSIQLLTKKYITMKWCLYILLDIKQQFCLNKQYAENSCEIKTHWYEMWPKKKKKTVKKIKEPCGTHIFNYQLLESLLLAHNSNILLMKFKI